MSRRSVQLKNQSGGSPVAVASEEKQLSDYGWHELRAYAKSLGLSTYRVNRSDLEAAIHAREGGYDG